MKMMKFALCITAAMAMLLVSGCDSKEKNNGAASSPETTAVTEQASAPKEKPVKEAAVEPRELAIEVYYPNNDGTKLQAESRKISTDKQDKYTAAMKSLMAGSKDKNQTTIIPKQARLKSVKVKDGLATVDFSKEIEKNFVGGSTGEEMMIGSIVNTLTQFPEVKEVRILVEGRQVETIAGHMDLSAPLGRMQQLLP